MQDFTQTSEGQAAVRPCRWSPFLMCIGMMPETMVWREGPTLTHSLPHHMFSACLCCSHSMKPEFVGLRTDIEDAGDKNKTSKKNGWWKEEEKRITWKDLWWREGRWETSSRAEDEPLPWLPKKEKLILLTLDGTVPLKKLFVSIPLSSLLLIEEHLLVCRGFASSFQTRDHHSSSFLPSSWCALINEWDNNADDVM